MIHTNLQKVLPPNKGNVDGPRIGIFAEPGLQYVAATWASWLSGGIAVPLAVSHPEHELDYIIRDAGISAVSAASGRVQDDKWQRPCYLLVAFSMTVPQSASSWVTKASRPPACNTVAEGAPTACQPHVHMTARPPALQPDATAAGATMCLDPQCCKLCTFVYKDYPPTHTAHLHLPVHRC